MAKSPIVTGQYVTLEQTPASVSDRLLASLIDYAIMFAYEISIMFGLTLYLSDVEGSPVITFCVVIALLLGWLYHPLMEVFHRGQSIGKSIMKIRVASVDGTAPTLAGYLLRFIFRPIDIGLSGLGLVSVIVTPHNQRLGDLAAGTMVIKTQPKPIQIPDYRYTMEGYTPTYPEAAELNLNQSLLVSNVLNATGKNRYELIDRLAQKVRQTLDITPLPGAAEQFLQTVLNDYSYYCSTIEA